MNLVTSQENKSLTTYTKSLKDKYQKAFVVYITAGLPGWVDAIHIAHEEGADIVEVGIPFSDPIMDGPIIAQASSQVLHEGIKTLDIIKTLQQETFIKPIVVMTYLNIIYVHGIDSIVPLLQSANISGLILPDLTWEHSSFMRNELSTTDISLIQLVASTTNAKRQKEICQASQGFTYVVAIKGITGQSANLSSSFDQYIESVLDNCTVPAYCGVGIRSVEDAHSLSQKCDGVIVGTTIVEHMLNHPGDTKSFSQLIKNFRQAIDL